MDTDRNLLFGVLALQADLITADQFVQACTLWTTRKDKRLADLLIEQGWLTAADRTAVEHLLERKLNKHQGDARASLVEVASTPVQRLLGVLNDPDLRQSLDQLSFADGHILLTTTAALPQTRERYTLTRLHASGGIGRVWLARDSSLGRDVALKELLPERMDNPALWNRFLKEAQITGQLEHPAIVPVYELARQSESQPPFYTMRFVRGRTLTEAIGAYHAKRQAGQAGPLDLSELLNAFVGVCQAVAYAHSRGVIHRDLKGQNVVLGDYGEVIVLDWGLAKLIDRPEEDAAEASVVLNVQGPSEATVHGQVLGTPAYMAPEQAEGRLEQIDQRTDVYGLGAILYEILAGQPPFTGSNTQEVLRKVRQEEPARPRAVCAGVPAALEAVCLRALAKNRTGRYATAAEMAQEVQRWLAGEPVLAYREPLGVRAQRWARHHRTAVVSSAVALLLMIASGVGGLFLWREAEYRRARQTEAYLADLRRSAQDGAAAALAELRAGRFVGAEKLLSHAAAALQDEPRLAEFHSRLENQWQRSRGLVEFYRLADQAERLAFLEYDEEALAACEGALTNLEVLHDREWATHLPAADLTNPEDADPERLLRQLREDVYRTFLLLSGLRLRPALMKSGDDPVVVDGCRSALEAVELAHHFRPSFSGRLLERFCAVRLGQWYRVLTANPAAAPTSAADYYFAGMAHVWIAAAEKDDAIRRLLELPWIKVLSGLDFQKPGQTSERYLRTAADREPRHYWSHFWLAWSFGVAGDFRAAAQAYDACVALRPNYALGYAHRGHMLILERAKTSDTEQRRELERRGLEDLNRALTLEPDEPFIHWLRAWSLSHLGKISEALGALGHAMELEPPLAQWKGQHIGQEKETMFKEAANLARTVTARDPGHVEAWATLATAELALEHFAEARTAAGRALALRPDDARSLAVRGALHLHERQFEPALADFRRALQSAPRDYRAAAGAATACLALGRFQESLADFDHLSDIAVANWQRAEAHLGRARNLARLGRVEEARHAQSSARQVHPFAGKGEEIP